MQVVARGLAGCLKGGHIFGGPVLRTGARVALGLCLLLWSGGVEAGALAPPRTEDVTFRSGELTLAGTLWLPTGTAPRAAVVLLPDESPGTRDAVEPYPAFLIQQGLAVLAYDRRGSGRSAGEGQPWASGLRELADDGLAAAKWLRERTGVRDVGLMGFGQGAWAAVQAAAREQGLGFVVLVSGGGGPLWKQQEHRLRNEARARGLTGPEVVDLMEHLGALDDARLYTPEREAKALKTLDFQFKRAKRRRWFALSPLSRVGDMPLPRLLVAQRAVWNNVLSYDATEDLGRIRAPVLALLGEVDEVTPTQSVSRALSQAPSVTVKVLRGADHRLAKPPGSKPVEDVFTTLESWLRAPGGP